MITEQELVNAIAECEKSPVSYQNCQKLATFYTVLDHLTGSVTQNVELVVGEYGTTDFLTAASGKNSALAWAIMDELMTALQVLNPRLYNSTLEKFR